jgi:hypothetical protein
MKMSVIETLFYTNLGGILGVVVFFYFWDLLIRMWKKYWPERFTIRRRKRKIFTKATRRIVRIKVKYGLPGIAILSPVILSIPIGAYLAAKYYGIRPKTIMILITGQIFWSVIYTIFYTQVKTILIP